MDLVLLLELEVFTISRRCVLCAGTGRWLKAHSKMLASCGYKSNPSSFNSKSRYGENLYKSSSTHLSSPEDLAKATVQKMYDESKQYNYNRFVLFPQISVSS